MLPRPSMTMPRKPMQWRNLTLDSEAGQDCVVAQHRCWTTIAPRSRDDLTDVGGNVNLSRIVFHTLPEQDLSHKERSMTQLPLARGLAASLVVVAMAALGMAFNVGAAAPAKGNATLGKPLFVKNCVVCHKVDGSGGMKLTGNPTPNWKDPKVWADPIRTDDYLRDCIVTGKVKSGMVAWGKSGQLKPADIENVIAYIKTFKPVKK
jgi:mono/diheme cytochrome c family protein